MTQFQPSSPVLHALQRAFQKLPGYDQDLEGSRRLSRRWRSDNQIALPRLKFHDWDQLRGLLDILQQHNVALYTSPGITPLHENGLQLELEMNPQRLPPLELDKRSMLLHCDSRYPIDAIESYARIGGLTAGFRIGSELPLVAWLERGVPQYNSVGGGRPTALVYALKALLPGGESISLGRAPRDAAGPSLRSLFWGTGGTFGLVEHVTLRLQPRHGRIVDWKMTFPNAKSLLPTIRGLLHRKSIPEDFHIVCEPADLPLDGLCTLYLQAQPQCSEAWVKALSPLATYKEQLPLCPPPKLPRTPYWLACKAPWTEAATPPSLIARSLHWATADLTIAHAEHTGALWLWNFHPPATSTSTPDNHSEALCRSARELQAQGYQVWCDARLVPRQQLDPDNLPILRALKQRRETWPQFNPHVLYEATDPTIRTALSQTGA